jgi:hypothetical protein
MYGAKEHLAWKSHLTICLWIRIEALTMKTFFLKIRYAVFTTCDYIIHWSMMTEVLHLEWDTVEQSEWVAYARHLSLKTGVIISLLSLNMHRQKLSKISLPAHKLGREGTTYCSFQQYHHCLNRPSSFTDFGTNKFLSWLVNPTPSPTNTERSMPLFQGFLP